MSAIAPADASAPSVWFQRLGAEAIAGAIADMYEDHNAVRITLSCVECRIVVCKLTNGYQLQKSGPFNFAR